ncbi:MAG: hypothetical protein KF824_11935 [Fimbriimonadaceae bacterium]|nr:MAG: hypothetical protein KF824_11935 [Fimbriimonadaceae bacterium]
MSIRRLGFLAVLLAIFGMGCLWDSDTLAQELKGLPELPDIIAGRIERNPDLYYEMRIARIEKVINNSGSNVPEMFFDLAVAYDKLGRDDEAIKCLEDRWDKYHSVTDIDYSNEKQTELSYKRNANLGTFYIHRGIGLKEDGLGDLKKGLALIEKAVEINPNAHFGREVVQIALVKDLIWELGSQLDQRPPLNIPKKELRRGLLGIVVLGGAWESPRIWAWIAGTLNARDSNVNHLIMLRCKELGATDEIYRIKLPRPLNIPYYWASGKANIESEFAHLRKSADKYQQNRTDFMLSKLNLGLHPDTDSHFWDGYKESPKYVVRDTPATIVNAWFSNSTNSALVTYGAIIGAVVGVYVWFRRKCRA